MQSLSLKRVKPSPTIAMTTLAQELKAQGRDIISLSAGEPDFDTPEHIKQAAAAAIAAGKTKYTAPDGMPELKQAICKKFSRENALEYHPSQISVGTGGKPTLFNALMATLNAGDEVIIPAPYWVSYPAMTQLAQGIPVPVRTSFEHSYRLTPEQLEEAITDKTRVLILCSPSNPTGSCYSKQDLEGLAEVLRRYPNISIISDEIYEYIVFDEEHISLLNVAPDLKDRVALINGFSKGFAMTVANHRGATSLPMRKARDCLHHRATRRGCRAA